MVTLLQHDHMSVGLSEFNLTKMFSRLCTVVTDLEKCLCSWYCHHMESRQCFSKIQNLSYKKESGPRSVGSEEENTMELATEYNVLKTDILA